MQAKAKRLGDDDPALARCLSAKGNDESSADQPTPPVTFCSRKHPEACVASCRAADPNACTLWARAHPLPSCAARLFEAACKLADMTGCYEQGLLSRPNHERRNDAEDAKARLLWERACDGGQAQACTGLGRLYTDPDGKWHDPVKALLKLDKGCDRDEPEACFLAALMHRSGKHNPANASKATKRFGTACSLRHAGACLELAQAHQNGVGVTQNLVKAKALYERACTLGNGNGCFMVAVSKLSAAQRVAMSSGSTPQWTVEQRKWLALSCDKGYLPSCQSLAFSHFLGKRYDEAVEVSTKLIAGGGLDWRPRYTRGMALYDLGRFAEAARDLELLCSARVDMTHCELWLFGARGRSGADGKPALSAKAATVDLSKWPGPVMQYFLGKLSPGALMHKAKNKSPRLQLEQECEAHYYIGVMHMIQGKKALARTRFKKTVAMGITNFIEHSAAVMELRRMGIKPP